MTGNNIGDVGQGLQSQIGKLKIGEFMKSKLSPVVTGFLKKHNTQECILNKIENWRRNIDKSEYVSTPFRF